MGLGPCNKPETEGEVTLGAEPSCLPTGWGASSGPREHLGLSWWSHSGLPAAREEVVRPGPAVLADRGSTPRWLLPFWVHLTDGRYHQVFLLWVQAACHSKRGHSAPGATTSSRPGYPLLRTQSHSAAGGGCSGSPSTDPLTSLCLDGTRACGWASPRHREPGALRWLELGLFSNHVCGEVGVGVRRELGLSGSINSLSGGVWGVPTRPRNSPHQLRVLQFSSVVTLSTRGGIRSPG